MQTFVVLKSGEAFDNFEESTRGVLTDAGWIDWECVAGFRCWSNDWGRYFFIPLD